MPNYTAASRTRQRLGLEQTASRTPFPERPEVFTPDDWRSARKTREAIDTLTLHRRWQVTVVPTDGEPRDYYLRGTLESVTERARHFFPEHLRSLTIELADVGGEVIDRRTTNLEKICEKAT